MEKFIPIECGETLPIKNIHAVSVSMPNLQDVIDYEEQRPEILEKIKSGYPRFILHPYLKILASFIKNKYKVSDAYEVVLLSSKKAVEIVSSKYFIHNKIEIDEPFGVILVINGTSQLKNVLMFIQHVGCNLSSRLAQEYLYDVGLIESKLVEELEDKSIAKERVLEVLSDAYSIKKENIELCTSGMNAMYGCLKGIKSIQAKNSRNILIQLGWLYLDTMNIVKHYFDNTKLFYDIQNLDILEEYLQNNGDKVSAIVTEAPTNPLLKMVDLDRLKSLCNKFDIPLIIDTTFATPYNIEFKKYGDIFIESLTKFACGNADVLMGAIILNDESKYSVIKNEYFKHIDKAYIQDIQRIAVEIKGYNKRVEKVSQNAKELVDYFKRADFIDEIYYACFDENRYCGIVSVTFKKPFKEVYDKLNFAKGPSLGTEFTLLMPYTYLAHYDYINSVEGREILKKSNLPIDLLRISVGIENIEDIKEEFERLNQ